MVKCREHHACKSACLKCDINSNIGCDKVFELDKPTKFIEVKREDHMNTSWNECPTCGISVGYRPKEKGFRCTKCNQLIAWK